MDMAVSSTIPVVGELLFYYKLGPFGFYIFCVSQIDRMRETENTQGIERISIQEPLDFESGLCKPLAFKDNTINSESYSEYILTGDKGMGISTLKGDIARGKKDFAKGNGQRVDKRTTGSVPQDWRIANVVPIFKKGSKSEPGNYRPVSLTSIVGKIFEGFLRDVILDYLNENNCLTPYQHGFMRNRSCQTNLISFYEEVSYRLDHDIRGLMMARCHTDCIQKPLSRAFSWLGKLVGRYPWWFLLIPFALSAGLGAGFYFLPQRQANDIEEQFTPIGGPAKSEREFVRTHFPTNDSGQFSPQRLYTEGLFVSLIAVSTSDNVINVQTFEELMKLDEMVQNFAVMDPAANESLTFHQLCAEIQGKTCMTINPLLSAVQGNVSLIATIPISYPMFQGKIFLGTYLGGVTLNSDDVVQKAKAIKLVYYLREDSESDRERSLRWINEFIKFFTKNSLQLTEIKVSIFTAISRQQEFNGTTKTVIPLFSITYFVTIFFAIVSCVRFDCVRNKFWVAGFGVISSGLAVLSSFGLLLLCGVPFVVTVANAPFLILGVGVDDMFIMVSSWQQTKVKDKVEERMAETYAEAAVSITITTLTDVLAFYIGILTSFKSVQSFCIYTGTAILFCFLYNVTCFGAFLALNGRREESNRHWFTCMKVAKEKDDHRSSAYNMCCVGGGYSHITDKETDHPMTSFFSQALWSIPHQHLG
ncbi:unnamed protein product [Ranitomeya imitator]|uniref:SSD domain-containing protein n=1 Tax=Ranitomeya imitator TaxID=111125 RepID=A0ABN9MI67_9NEOB|nr:unnamed protein product [Ranitomeya imitator]